MTRRATLFGSLAGLAITVTGYRPLMKRCTLSLYPMTFGPFATDFPLQILAGHVTALAAVSRSLSPRIRWLSWLVSAISWLGLLGLHRIGQAANMPLSAALDTGLGKARRTDSAGLWIRPTPGRAIAKKPGLVRTLRIYRDYAHDTDIAYGEHGTRNLLDIWRRPDLDRNGRAPVLLQIPGGAWMLGSKRGQAHPLMSHMAELGWVCVSINYRLSPRATWPDHIVDVKRVISWIKANIAQYGGDGDWIAITGGSAGAHLCALAALTPNAPQFQPGFEDADTRVQAAIPFYGVYDLTRTDDALHPLLVPALQAFILKNSRRRSPDTYREASPITHVSADAPPFFVLHGRADTMVPVEQARSFTARLQDISHRPAVYAELPFAHHAFDMFGTPRAAHTAVAVEQFLAEIYAPRSAAFSSV
ncbi:MAG: alpha/beta hydrolase fold domain-containing protein [Mycobacterium sp.]